MSTGGWKAERNTVGCEAGSERLEVESHCVVLSETYRTRGVSESFSKWAGLPLFSAPLFVPDNMEKKTAKEDHDKETSRGPVSKQSQSHR